MPIVRKYGKYYDFWKNIWIFGKIVVPLQRETKIVSVMRVIARKKIVDYYSVHPQAKTALDEWYTKTEEAEWKSLADIKQTFNSVDYVGNQHYVFNIKGNDFRLVVVIKFTPQYVFIRFIGTHAEYDKITDIQNL
jgi:mRNA interferase HigB